MPARRWSQLVDSIINIFEDVKDGKDENAACLFHLRVASWSSCCNTEDSGRIDLNLVIAILAELPLAWFFVPGTIFVHQYQRIMMYNITVCPGGAEPKVLFVAFMWRGESGRMDG